MNILILHAHWNNRGDEAALRAMLDELRIKLPSAKFRVLLITESIQQDLDLGNDISLERNFYPRTRDLFFEIPVELLTKGGVTFTKRGRRFVEMVKNADIVIHAPGGPSIGDIYLRSELFYLFRLLLVYRVGTPYVFYAPSMGPFNPKTHHFRNFLRRKVLNNAALICVREPLSKKYIQDFGKVQEPIVTLDSAFQHEIDYKRNELLLNKYKELNLFISSYNKIIGITITDLLWNPKFSDNLDQADRIEKAFKAFISYLRAQEYGVIFIPQLFGLQNDRNYMSKFALENCFVMDDTYDCYFQQFVISKLYAVVGMRYHSNIFSAKMETPFISIAYEQKMSGFMKSTGLSDYCLDISILSYEQLKDKFEFLEKHYTEYKSFLRDNSKSFKEQSYETTRKVCNILNQNSGE